MHIATNVATRDLAHIRSGLAEEFERLAGKKLLITGGAGFLGYYLVQAPLYWNATASPDRRIQVTVFDNYIRGVPRWLQELRTDPNLHLVEHDITRPLP